MQEQFQFLCSFVSTVLWHLESVLGRFFDIPPENTIESNPFAACVLDSSLIIHLSLLSVSPSFHYSNDRSLARLGPSKQWYTNIICATAYRDWLCSVHVLQCDVILIDYIHHELIAPQVQFWSTAQ